MTGEPLWVAVAVSSVVTPSVPAHGTPATATRHCPVQGLAGSAWAAGLCRAPQGRMARARSKRTCARCDRRVRGESRSSARPRGTRSPLRGPWNGAVGGCASTRRKPGPFRFGPCFPWPRSGRSGGARNLWCASSSTLQGEAVVTLRRSPPDDEGGMRGGRTQGGRPRRRHASSVKRILARTNPAHSRSGNGATPKPAVRLTLEGAEVSPDPRDRSRSRASRGLQALATPRASRR